MGRDIHCPADGFHFLKFGPLLLSVNALFLLVTLLPACTAPFVNRGGDSVADMVFADTAHILMFGAETIPLSGIMQSGIMQSGIIEDTLTRPEPQAPLPDLETKLEIRDDGPSFARRVAELSTSRAIWLLALTPWVWGRVIWATRRRKRRRSRRYE